VSSYWDGAAARSDGRFAPVEFEQAAYRLVCEQVLYYADRHSRTAYHLLVEFEREVRTALAPTGVDVGVNRQFRYVYAIPSHGKAGTASTAQTLFALVLRQVYDEAARAAELTDDGEAVCGLVELQEKYRLMVGREFPSKSELRDLMRVARRWGIARPATGHDDELLDGELDGQEFAVMIRPAIAVVLGESALARLASWSRIETPESADHNAESGELS
jgi:hypothetical protein